MPSFNQVVLMGHLARDPELRYIPQGAAVANFTVAANHRFTKKDGEKVDEVAFVDVTVWERLAEICAEYLKQGRAVQIVGRLVQDRWEDKTSGQKRSKLRVTASQVIFLNGGSQDDESAPPAQEETSATREKPNGARGPKSRNGRKPQAGPPVEDDRPF